MDLTKQLGLRLTDFTWTGGPAEFRNTLAAHVRNAEAAGIARITVMDHFWQIPQIGPVNHDMFEAYSILGFIAAHTNTALLRTLVTGVTYREPALLAKAITTLDVISDGHAGLGIGAAWNAEESNGLGIRFPPVRERFERLEETINICRQLWSDCEDPHSGQHYQLGPTLDAPGPLHAPHLMIGGGGEKRTLKLVAEYADACNLFPGPDLAHKLDVLRTHCDTAGRDYDQIETISLTLEAGQSADDLVRAIDETRELGFTAAYVNAIAISEPNAIIDVFARAITRIG